MELETTGRDLIIFPGTSVWVPHHLRPQVTSVTCAELRHMPPPPMPRQSYVGEVGWGWQYHQLLNSGTLLSNMQIKRTELRTALEDRVTHRFQEKKKEHDR
ncbi:uncharacterized protein C4orf45 homolog isoform X1 [Lates japonicus]